MTPRLSEDEANGYSTKTGDNKDAGDIKPLDLLIVPPEIIHLMGVLNMDVDNLGKLFAEGLGQHANLARVAAFSFAISLNFEGWVGYLAQDSNARNI